MGNPGDADAPSGCRRWRKLLFAQARRQFDTNLFGLARLTQLVIPGTRQAGGGTIINLSSVFGRFAVPGGDQLDCPGNAGALPRARAEPRRWRPGVVVPEARCAISMIPEHFPRYTRASLRDHWDGAAIRR
jgi:NAD(P)-dependent dehydrogenase (short-subunit alcohol dehydrogenase family)